MTITELDEKVKQYIDSLTDDYFENTSKYELVKNAFVTGLFFAESCLVKKTIRNLEKENANLKAQIEKMKIQAQIDSYDSDIESMDFI